MQLLLDIQDDKAELFLEFIKNISFIRSTEKITSGQITNPAILQSIQDYETGKVQPVPFSLQELKTMVDA
jgi:hypothetical protein